MSKKDIRDIIKEQLNKPDGNVEVAEVVEIVPNQMDGEGDDKFLNPPVSFGEQMAETFGLLPREWRVFLTNHEAENEQKLKDLSSQVDAFAWVSQLAEPRQERFKKYGFRVFYNALITYNDIRFSTLTKTQRQETSRNFKFTLHKQFSFIILVDDIITTGETLLEASQVIMQHNRTPLFAWTLCDSRF